MEHRFAPAYSSFAIGWLRIDSDNENSEVRFCGNGICCVRRMTLNKIGTDKDMVRLLLMLSVGGQKRLWEHAFSTSEPLEILLWVHSCMTHADEIGLANRFMEYYRDEKRTHEREERNVTTSMSMLDFLQRVAASQKLTKNRFGEIMHGDYTEEEKQKALEQMEMAGGYDNLADD